MVAGGSRGGSDDSDWTTYTTIKYAQTPVSVYDKEPTVPRTYWLSQNYPNPFNPSTTIHYKIPSPGYVTIKVLNLAGQKVATLVSENKPAGDHKVQWNPDSLPSGEYLYRLQAGDFVETRKMVLIR